MPTARWTACFQFWGAELWGAPTHAPFQDGAWHQGQGGWCRGPRGHHELTGSQWAASKQGPDSLQQWRDGGPRGDPAVTPSPCRLCPHTWEDERRGRRPLGRVSGDADAVLRGTWAPRGRTWDTPLKGEWAACSAGPPPLPGHSCRCGVWRLWRPGPGHPPILVLRPGSLCPPSSAPSSWSVGFPVGQVWFRPVCCGGRHCPRTGTRTHAPTGQWLGAWALTPTCAGTCRWQ